MKISFLLFKLLDFSSYKERVFGITDKERLDKLLFFCEVV
jgi:hypothetical protein